MKVMPMDDKELRFLEWVCTIFLIVLTIVTYIATH